MIPSKKYLKHVVSSNLSLHPITGVQYKNGELIATDGSMAAFYNVGEDDFNTENENKKQDNILQLDSFDFKKNDKPSFVFEKNDVIVTNGNSVKTERMLEGRFPKAHNVIPSKIPDFSVLIDLVKLKKICDATIENENPIAENKGKKIALFEFNDPDDGIRITPQFNDTNQLFVLMPVGGVDKTNKYFSPALVDKKEVADPEKEPEPKVDNEKYFGYTLAEINEFEVNGTCPTVKDCCTIEPDGICEHGEKSILLELGIM